MSLERSQQVTVDPDYYAPYAISQGIRTGNLVFISGQAGITSDGQTVQGGFEAQARQVLANISNVLVNSGSSLADVVKVTIHVTDMSHLDKIIALRKEFFTEPYPADTLLQVAGLAQRDWMIEIDAVAQVPPAANQL